MSGKYVHICVHMDVYIYIYMDICNVCVYTHKQNPVSEDPSLLRSATC